MSQDDIFDQGARPMPERVKHGLIRVQGNQWYLKAPYRVLWMRIEHPDWSILTDVIYADWNEGFAVVKASILDAEGRVLATAHSEESRGKLPYLKKAETGAIARALGLVGYGTNFGELDEEEIAESTSAVNGYDRQPAAASASRPGAVMPINDGSGPCVACGAPPGKVHASKCKLAREGTT